jgi:ATP-dependent helicase/DNAse subunit B
VRENEDILLGLHLRRELGLPTVLDQETLQFYYLKRIIDSSEGSYLLSLVDRKGEMDVRSRFWYYFSEGHYEVKECDAVCMLPLKTKDKELDYPSITQPVLSSIVHEVSRLDLDRLKRCETLYYISRVLNIKDEEILKRKIDVNLLGLKVHALFTELYSDSLYSGFDERIREPEEYRPRFDELFNRHFKDGTFFTSEEVLTKKILMSNLLEVLDRDMNRFCRGYRICTEFMEKEFSASVSDKTSSYIIKGRIDRIDITPEGLYEIIDYKTGKLPEINSHFQDRDFREPQLGFYGLLFKKNHPDAPIGALCYYDISEKKDLEVIVDADHVTDYLESFEKHLVDFLKALNQKEYLSLTEDYENCKYCPYYNICRVFEE